MPAELSEDPYAILGVSRTASPADIKETYRRLAKATHPDIDARPEAMAAMVRINHAYELLADPYRRARWDALNPVERRARHGPGSAPRPGGSQPRGSRPTGAGAGTRDWPGRSTGRGGPRSAPSQAPPRGSTPPAPSLDEAFAFRFGTGKYQGRTIREVVVWDRGYVEWVARTARDRPRLAMAARRVLMHLDELERDATDGGPAMGTTLSPDAEASTGSSGPRGWLTRDRAVILGVASLAAIVTFAVAWLLIILLGS